MTIENNIMKKFIIAFYIYCGIKKIYNQCVKKYKHLYQLYILLNYFKLLL